MNVKRQRGNSIRVFALLFVLLPVTIGCAEMPWASSSAPAASSSATSTTRNEPYYPTDYKDLLIPGELDWSRDASMTIKTDAFSGGILAFTGRVDVKSLTNFFISSMVTNHWKMSGSVEAKDVLLAFMKPQQTCMIRIVEGEFGLKTNVFVYITKELTGKAPAMPAFGY